MINEEEIKEIIVVSCNLFKISPVISYEVINDYYKYKNSDKSLKIKLVCKEDTYCLVINNPCFSTCDLLKLRSDVIDFLGNVIECPKPIKVSKTIKNEIIAEKGDTFFIYKNRAIELYTWCSSQPYDGSKEAFTSTSQFSGMVSRHLDLIPLASTFNTKRYRTLEKRNIINGIVNKSINFDIFRDNPEVNQLMDINKLNSLLAYNYDHVEKNKEFINTLPIVVVHGDLHLGNIGYLDGKAKVLYDFEFVRYGLRIEDIVRIFYETCLTVYLEENSSEIFIVKIKQFWKEFWLGYDYTPKEEYKDLIWAIAVIKLLKEIYMCFQRKTKNEFYNNEYLEYETLSRLKVYLSLIEYIFENGDVIRKTM